MKDQSIPEINIEQIDATTEVLIEGVFMELVSLQEYLKPKIKRMEELKTWCKTLGSYATENYVCSVRPQEKVCLVSLDKAIEALGRSLLEEKGLIQTVSFEVVSVSPKFII